MSVKHIIYNLIKYWEAQGCSVVMPFDMEKGAATAHPSTFFASLSKEESSQVYVEQCRRPQDGRYGKSPNRLYRHHQLQVFIKPAPADIKNIYLKSLEAIGLNLEEHDIKFLEDNWEQPTLGAWGLGSEVRLDGLEVTQFTYFQQVGKIDIESVPIEIAYGVERLAMYIQDVDNVYDLEWDKGVKYSIFREYDRQESEYCFEVADPSNLRRLIEIYTAELKRALGAKLYHVGYEYILKVSNAFNILDATKSISTKERQTYILEISRMSKQLAQLYVEA